MENTGLGALTPKGSHKIPFSVRSSNFQAPRWDLDSSSQQVSQVQDCSWPSVSLCLQEQEGGRE